METQTDVENLEKLIGQLQGLHSEISQLARKSPNDGVNKFKLGLINRIVTFANEVLGAGYRPFDDFTVFDADDVPSTSDVALVLSQYMEEAERYRSDSVAKEYGHWVYMVGGEYSDIPAAPPSKIFKK